MVAGASLRANRQRERFIAFTNRIFLRRYRQREARTPLEL